jgi:hypothetical protein
MTIIAVVIMKGIVVAVLAVDVEMILIMSVVGCVCYPYPDPDCDRHFCFSSDCRDYCDDCDSPYF